MSKETEPTIEDLEELEAMAEEGMFAEADQEFRPEDFGIHFTPDTYEGGGRGFGSIRGIRLA